MTELWNVIEPAIGSATLFAPAPGKGRRSRNPWNSRNPRGFAMLLVLIAVAMAAVLSTAFLSSQSTSLGLTQNLNREIRARQIAESGIMHGVAYVRSTADWRTLRNNGVWLSNEPFAGGTLTLLGEDGMDRDNDGVIEGDGWLADDPTHPLTLTSTGSFDGVSSRARAVLHPVGLDMYPGLKAESFLGTKDHLQLADFDWLSTPVYTQIVDNIDYPSQGGNARGWPGGPRDHFATRYTGRVYVPASGLWTFYTESNDGSDLWIDGQQVVDNDGKHGMKTESGAITLTRGYHDLMVRHFEWKGNFGIVVSWQGPSHNSPSIIPASALSQLPLAQAKPGIAVSESITLSDQSSIDAFDAMAGPYGPDNVLGNRAVIATNATGAGTITLSGSALLSGHAKIGMGGNPSTGIALWGPDAVTGTAGALAENMVLPAIDDPDIDAGDEGNGEFTSSFTLSSDRRFNNLSITGNDTVVTVSGDVIVLCDGNLSLGDQVRLVFGSGSSLKLYVRGNASFDHAVEANDGGIPSRLYLYMLGTNKNVTLAHRARLCAHVQNPAGGMSVSGADPHFYGTYVGRNFSAGENAALHLDSPLGRAARPLRFEYTLQWQEVP